MKTNKTSHKQDKGKGSVDASGSCWTTTQVLSDNFQVWFFSNLCSHIRFQEWGVTWSCIFSLITWWIWKNRNLFIFQNVTCLAYEIVKTSFSWAQQLKLNHHGYRTNSLNSVDQTHSIRMWVHLFSDGAVARDIKNASTDDVVRDLAGN